jgi:hypothetical protein
VVTKPFGFEGRRRMQQALQAIENLRAVVDTLIIVSNDRSVGLFGGTYFPLVSSSPCFSTFFILSFAFYFLLLLSSVFLSFFFLSSVHTHYLSTIFFPFVVHQLFYFTFPFSYCYP